MPPLSRFDEITTQRITGSGHFDASESAFLSNQLTTYVNKVYEWKLPPLLMRGIIVPDTSTIPEGETTFVYPMYEPEGSAALRASLTDGNIPRADVIAREYTGRMRPILTSYGWSRSELLVSARRKTPLMMLKGQTARRAYEEVYDETARTGDSALGLEGFFNGANVPVVSASTKAAGGTAWETATPDEIVAEVGGSLSYVTTNTRQIYEPNLVALPTAKFQILKDRRMGDGSDKSILKWLMENHEGLVIVKSQWLDTAGAGNATRMVTATMGVDSCVIYEVPFQQMPPEQSGYEWTVNCHGWTSGAVWIYPLAGVYTDGV
jgi:hypothetical protein